MAVCDTGLPGDCIARFQHGLANIFAECDFAFEHIDELVFFLMPVALRGRRTRLERADVDAEMRKAGGTPEPPARSALDRLVEWRRIAGRGVELYFINVDLGHQTRSIIVAVPMPTPMQSVISAVSLSRLSSSSSTVPRIMAPVAPSG